MVLADSIKIGAVSFIVALAVAFVLRRMRSPPAVACAAGVGLGYIAGQLTLAGRAGLGWALTSLIRPREARDWLPLMVLLAMGVTTVATYAPRAWRPWVVGLATLLAMAVPSRLLAGHVARQWSLLEKLSHLALLAATLGLLWLLLGSAQPDEQPRFRAMLMVVVALAAAVLIAMSGSLTYGQLCAAVAAALMGASLAMLDSGAGLSGAAGVVVFSLGGVILLSCVYAQLEPFNAAMVLLALAGAGGKLPEFALQKRPWRRAALRAALCLLPLVAAIIGAR